MPSGAIGIFRSQCISRHLDRMARQDAEGGAGLLHDRLVRARGHGRRRRGAAPDRHGLPALPRRRVPGRARGPGRRPESDPRHAAQLRLFHRRSDLRRAAQGAGLEGADDPAADLDHRQPSAESGRRGLFDRAGETHAARTCGARTRFHRHVFLRRCLDEPFDRAGRLQHGLLDGLSGGSAAADVRLRGQRHRYLRENPARLDRGEFLRPAGACLVRLRRARHLRYLFDRA